MTTEELEKMVRHGETSRVQFKQRFTTPKQLAEDSHVEFVDSKQGNQFTARVSRLLTAGNIEKAVSNVEKAVSNVEKAVSNAEGSRSNGNEAVSKSEKAESKERLLLDFCKEPRSMSDICEYLGLKDRYKVKKKYVNPLLNVKLSMTEPDSPNSPTQKYVAIKNR